MSNSQESFWQRQIRLYGHDQSQWWSKMPIDEQIEMVKNIIEGGAIPVYAPTGANTLHGRGAPIGEVIDCILVLLMDRKVPSVIEWFNWLKDGSERLITDRGIRVWILQRGYI